VTTHPGHHRFPGQTRVGRYCRARYYHPGRQRFISEDPIEFDAGDINLYAYVSNAPTRFVDPLGLEKERRCSFGDRYLQHLDAYLINVGPAAAGLLGGLWPKSLAPATGGRGPFLGSANPLTSVPRAFGGFGIPIVAAAAATTAGQFTAASIGVATVGIGYYNVGVFTSGLAYAAFPGWNGLPAEGCR
jgi:RHS repeat-associated protein